MRRRSVAWQFALSALALWCAAPHAGAAQINVEVSRDGLRFEVRAVARLHADIATTFATLTDYEQLPRFIPDVRSVRVLHREWNADPAAHGEAAAQERLLVEQQGEFRIWWFSQAVQIRLNVVHLNGDEVRAWLAPVTGIDGEVGRMVTFAGRYKVEPVGDNGRAVRLTYDARFEPQFHVPPLIGTHAVRHTVTEQFAAMALEIERRFAAR